MGKMLYHFTSCESLLKILLSNELRFSKSKTLDDPFERWRARNYFDWTPNIPETAPAAKFLNYFNNLVDQTNVLCFFDDQNEKNEDPSPISNLKMWSHYGKSHQGCCIVLDKEKTVNLFKNNVKGCISNFGRVEYTNLKNYEGVWMSTFEAEEYKKAVFDKLFHDLFFYKAAYYSEENEFRFAVNNGNINFSFEVLPLIIRVIVAENAKQIDTLSVVALSKILSIEVGKMVISDDKLEYQQLFAPEHSF